MLRQSDLKVLKFTFKLAAKTILPVNFDLVGEQTFNSRKDVSHLCLEVCFG